MLIIILLNCRSNVQTSSIGEIQELDIKFVFLSLKPLLYTYATSIALCAQICVCFRFFVGVILRFLFKDLLGSWCFLAAGAVHNGVASD